MTISSIKDEWSINLVLPKSLQASIEMFLQKTYSQELTSPVHFVTSDTSALPPEKSRDPIDTSNSCHSRSIQRAL